ncbi:MAG: transporter ATP-binding protein [Frankiales bacterium]|nr:transporter ATP-binding protein [Frankiales bacterium]
MSDLIKARGLGKRYVLRSQSSLLGAVFGSDRRREFWALKDLDMELNPGEVLAVVGRNGAGKSTLLKIAAGVTRPTTGTLTRTSRIAPLIEVGAGFHPELSGRENVEINGRLLGLSSREIRQKFDDIVDFSELAHAIDQPVKEYSSGMFMRLGFSVAVHTTPEMLVVDEVLAVGDMPFQLRCLDRIRAMRADGVGILFVSHNMSSVLELADRAIFLERGEVRATGLTRDVVGAYHARLQDNPDRPEGVAASDALQVDVLVRRPDGDAPLLWAPLDPVVVELTVTARRDAGPAIVGFRLNREGTGLVSAWHQDPHDQALPAMKEGEVRKVALQLDLNVVPGSYDLEVALAAPDFTISYAHLHDAAHLAVGGPRAAGIVDVNPRLLPPPTGS